MTKKLIWFCAIWGVAHIYNKLWHLTKEPAFQDACVYWFNKTVDLSRFSDGVGGYKKYDSHQNAWVKDSGLLEGAAGIGLAIISYLFVDYSWDYCLMLNE